MGEIRHVPLIILGLGNVGPVLLGQVFDTRDVLAKRTGLRITPIGLADSGAALLEPNGLSDSSLPAALSAKNDRRSLGTPAERRPRSLVANAL